MGVFNKINEKSGIVVGVIALGLGLFLIGGDLFTSNSGSSTEKVGEIDGDNITAEDLRKAMIKAENLYGGGGANYNMEDLAWNQLIFDKVYKEAYEEAGITLSEEEQIDLLEGDNMSEVIKQQFGSKEQLQQFIKYLDSDQFKSEEERQATIIRWKALKEYVYNERLRNKYENVLKKTEYVTKAEAKRYYSNMNEKVEAKYLYIPYYSVKDSSVTITDEMLESYLKKHQNEYKVEAGRSIEYAIFNNTPNAKDSAIIRTDLAKLKPEFVAATNDSLFVKANSDAASEPAYMPISQLPDALSKMANELTIDSVYGPFPYSTGFALSKILKIESDTNVMARASHILFRANETDPADKKGEAKKQAETILKEIQNGASFEKMAAQYGGDGTASRGGDLGWFGKGQMVKPFENAIFNANKPGVLPYIVETQFGYHIIRIDVPKTGRKYLIANVLKNVEAFDETRDSIYRAADMVRAAATDTATFRNELKKYPSVMKQEQLNIESTAKTINGLTDGREIVKWIYNDDREVGDASYVFTIEDKDIVVLVTSIREKGDARLADVKDQLKAKVMIEEKAAKIKSKLQPGADLTAIAKAYGTDALTGTAPDVIMSSGMINGVGYEPEAVGTLFGLKPGKRSEPLTGDNGVLIVECVKTTPAEVADYAQFQNQIQQQRNSRIGFGVIDEALRKSVEILDLRYRF